MSLTQAMHHRTSLWRDDDVLEFPAVFADSPRPRFGDDRWSLECLERPSNRSTPVLSFEGFAGQRKTIAKELMAARLTKRFPMRGKRTMSKPIKAPTLMQQLNALRHAFDFMDEQKVSRIEDLTQAHLNSYLRMLQERRVSASYQYQRLVTFAWLWETRDFLTRGALTFNPWNGMPLNFVVGARSDSETKAKRIPEDVMSGLMSWAMAYINYFSADIIPAVQLVADARRALKRGHRLTLREYLDELQARGEAVPARVTSDGLKIDKWAVSLRTGIARTSINDRQFDKAIAKIGVKVNTPGVTSAVLPGCRTPWRGDMALGEIVEESNRLVIAAYIVVASLSGMRDSEIQAIKRGSLEIVTDDEGRVYRYRIHGETFKGHRRPSSRVWVVIEPVARAIQVLERLWEPLHREYGEIRLFLRTDTKSGYHEFFRARVNSALRNFLMESTEIFWPRLRCTPEPMSEPTLSNLMPQPIGPDGPWHLTSSQFRKTLAWYIANRPMGLAAGMIQFGHASLQMFEGYAGTSRSGFRREVMSEAFAARVGDLVEHFKESHDGIYVAGPVAGELQAEFERISKQLGPLEGRVVDDRELRKLLRHRASRMRVGMLADCFFEPSRARCLEGLSPDKKAEGPLLGLCDPRCPQACWSKRHTHPLEQAREQAQLFRSLNRTSSLQRDYMRRQVELFDRMLREIREASNGRKP